MFLTAGGYLGLGHEGFNVGDIVCILSGGEVPYVHGVMDGEVVDDLDRSPLENFRIE
ncbi:hypothetical protein BDZ45DRAFT_600670 [Acephala macrosclerotiorum]|nr:hypothetical protein BDZ45DRAFT_600670 [Acephala macrosclerotiorum]